MAVTSPGFPDFPTVTTAIRDSNDAWAADLRLLFQQAHERFADVCWDANEGLNEENPKTEAEPGRVWGHKAIVYARAPKEFKDRYFPPSAIRPSHSPYSNTLPLPSTSSLSLSAPGADSPYNRANNRSQSALSIASDGATLRGSARSQYGPDGTLKLTNGGTPEMFRAQLEWLYTSEGMGDVVEWISDQDDVGLDFLGPSGVLSGNLRDSRGRKGGLSDRREKLGQDLTYMWRSKLYADVQIQLVTNELPSSSSGASHPDDEMDYESDSSSVSLSSTAVFSSHRFILCSRSPYFASLLLNQSQFRPRRTGSVVSAASMEIISLPSPPFTPAALHFCLGYLYNGSLSFSNRSFDLVTAFQIHRCASYLQLDTLRDEVEARIVWDFCHALEHGRCTCRRCALRAPRVWCFASAPDVGAVKLALLAREWVVKGWGECWGKEIGGIPQEEQDALVADVLLDLKPRNVISTFRGLLMTRRRVRASVQPAGGAAKWEQHLEKMLGTIEDRAVKTLVLQFPRVAASAEVLELLDGESFDVDVLETVLDIVKERIGRAEWCGEAGRIYQALVSSLLLRVNPQTRQTVLMMGSRNRAMVEEVREAIIAHLRRRWMLARDQHAFEGLENWALKEISDEIEVPVDELLTASATAVGSPAPRPSVARSTPPCLRASASSRSETVTSDTTSLRSVATSRSRTSLAPSQISSTSTLRLHSSPPRADMAAPAPSIASRLSQTSSNVASSSRLRAVTTPTPLPERAAEAAKGKARTSEGASTHSTLAAATAGSSMASLVSVRPAQAKTPSLAPPAMISDTKDKAVENETPRERTRNASLSSTKTTATTATTATAASRARTPTSSIPRSAPRPTKSPAAGTSRAAVVKSTLPAPTPVTPKTPSARAVLTTAGSSSVSASKVSSTPKVPIPRPSSSRSLAHPNVGSLRSKQATSPKAKSTAPSEQLKRPSSVNSVRSVKTTQPSTSIVFKAPASATLAKPTPPMPKNARVAIASHCSPSNASLSATAAAQPRRRAISSTNTQVTPRPAVNSPQPATKVSAVTAARLRTASLASNQASKPRPSGLSESNRGPVPSRSKVSAVASQFGGQPAIRWPSSSTDKSEARTPLVSESLLEPPAIIRTSSTESDLAEMAIELPKKVVVVPAAQPPVIIDLPANPPATVSPINLAVAPIPPTYIRKGSTSSIQTVASPSSRYHPAAAFDPPKAEKLILTLPRSHVVDDLKPLSSSLGIALDIGIPCIVSLQCKRARFKALARYIGRLEGCRGAWVGVEVDDASQEKYDLDVSDGSRQGTRYFHLSSPNMSDVSDPTERLARRRRIDTIGNDLVKVGLTSSKMTAFGLGSSLLPQPELRSGQRSSRGSLARSSSPFEDRMSTEPWGQFSWLGESQPRALFVRPSEVVFVEGAE